MSGVIEHVGIRVSDLSASRRMYEPALAELGFVAVSEGEFEGDGYVLFGRADSDDFSLHTVGSEPGRDRVTTGAHIAFVASDTGAVMRWHAAAVGQGGTDIGPPGVRPEYSGNYYAAFVLDPDGNNVEAVFHTPAESAVAYSASHASLTNIPVADVPHTDAKWTPVRNHFGITAFGINAYTARNAGDRLIGEHDHADPTDEQHQELYFVHAGHARFRVDGQDVDAPAGTFVSALDVKTIRSAVALSDNTVVLVIGAEPGAPFEVTPAERAELAAAGLPVTPA